MIVYCQLPQKSPSRSSFVFLSPTPMPSICCCGGGGWPPFKSMLANPFIKSLAAAPFIPPAGRPLLPPPKTPIRSSIPPPLVGEVTDGLATRCGVPAKPSSPDEPAIGAFCIDAGAAPSKSMSSRFSAFDEACGALAPEIAAVTAAAAIGFSRASCFASSMAAACSAELRPCPMKVCGGLW